jgi:pimeloyl-ACP methyl ester carboxylesterase
VTSYDHRREFNDTGPSRRTWWRRPGRLIPVAVGLLCVAVIANVRGDLAVAELVAKYGADPSRFITIEGMRVHYRDEGTGLPLLLIHGTSSSLHTWDGWVQHLQSRHRIIRLDLPGFGLTGPAPDADYRASRHARVVLGLLDRIGVERADVAGNSLGGRVALTLAPEHPTRVNRLILIDSRGLSGLQKPAIDRATSISVVGPALRWITPRALVRWAVEAIYADPARVTDELVDRYDDLIRRDGNRQAKIDAVTGPGDPDLDDRLGEVQAQVLLLWGRQDRRIPVSAGYRMRDGLREAKLVIYENAGHVPMEELPAETSADADAFLQGGLPLISHYERARSVSK